MNCVLCGRFSNDIDSAIDDGWIPSYWEGDDEIEGPVCPSCCNKHLLYNQDQGGFEPRPVHDPSLALEPMTMEQYG